MSKKVNFTVNCNAGADAKAQQVVNLLKTSAKVGKSTFNSSIWKDGMKIAIVGSDFVFNEEALKEALASNPNASAEDIANELRTYPVLLTELIAADGSRTPYKPLWLKTLLDTKDDMDGNELVPSGTFNVLARTEFDSKATDDEVLKGIIAGLAGRTVVCKRETKYHVEYFGRTKTYKLCEFDII